MTRFRIALVAAVPLFLAACGTGQQSGVATAGGGSASAAAAPSPAASGDAVKFAQCMREHGIDVPDPEPGGNAVRVRIKEGVDPATVEKANAECEEFRPIGGGPPMGDAAFADAVQKYTDCMRDNGVDMPDPKVDGGRMLIRAPKDVMDSPEAEKAQAICEKHLPGGGPK
ncbi:hypothetical protein GT755_07230 [Herbidospora sp. NEAU-GS84]|uniref:Secreted protein n=1 Tax=Herbidospora solisilvae TaxID=2696284 RepID=A0A7C9NZ70_9ACTN|nr:hypothetical protein [Herbidospora solisilvae]NAS21477.1 hypothetical protein [Herbidospora solisilvae]